MCIETLPNSASRALGGIISKSKQINDLGFSTYSHLFNTGVVPILDYGAGIWGHLEAKPSYQVQNKALRYYLGVHRYAPTSAIHCEMGWLHSKLRQSIEVFRLWNRLLTLDDSRITKRIFLWDKQLCRDNWCSKLESILNNFGYNEEIFDDNLIIDIPTAKLKTVEINKERFDIEIESKPKLRTYKLFKSDFSTEEYILKHRSKYERSILCQFRIGILPLNIETGRYKNIKDNISGKMRNLRPEERICDLCDLNIVEDELHFLCVCPVYNDERQNLYRKIDSTHNGFLNLEPEEKFIFIMTNCNPLLGKYLKLSWEKRRSLLFN